MFLDEEKQKKLKIMSMLPIFNWLMIMYLGINQMKLSYVFTGFVCISISVFNVYLLGIFWIIGVWYSRTLLRFAIYDALTKENLDELEKSVYDCEDDEFDMSTEYDMIDNLDGKESFTESDFEVMANRRQSTPVENFGSISVLERYFQALSERDKFLANMKKYADISKEKVEFVPFFQYWPSYKSLNHAQKYWYFYWRTEVRNGNYLDTSLSYIYIYIYELLSCVGEPTAQDCYNRLIRVWGAYRKNYTSLDNYLYDWTFDFCAIHNLEYTIRVDKNLRHFRKRFMIDRLICEQEKKERFTLSFYTIDAICNYTITKSAFYEKHKKVLQEAIPRAVELANAVYKSREGKSLFEMYPEYKEKKYEYFGFISAICEDQYKKIEFAYKPYSSNISFVQNIYEIARITQNTFMCLYKVGSNSPKMGLDVNISTIIESFVVNIYGYVADFEDEDDFIPYEGEINFDEEFLRSLERKVPEVKAVISELNEK